jgi:hypothetical protein
MDRPAFDAGQLAELECLTQKPALPSAKQLPALERLKTPTKKSWQRQHTSTPGDPVLA